LSDRAQQLIGELVHELAPVRPLPALRKVAALAIGLALAIVVFARAMATLAGQPPLKAPLQIFDLLGLAAQLALAGGMLTVALAECVPGREALGAAGARAAAVGALLLVAGSAAMLWGERAESLSGLVLRDTALCTLNSLVPAFALAWPLRRFVSRAAPRRRSLALFAGTFAAASFTCAPSSLACVQSGAFHGLLAHLLAPFLSACLVFAALRALDTRAQLAAP
jgi:hypothetical protein